MPSSSLTISFLSAVVFFATTSDSTPTPHGYKHALIIDAGSSGTRLWIYRWSTDYYGQILPRYEKVDSAKNTPGLSSFSDRQDIITSKIVELLDKAKGQVPEKDHSKTPVYLFATAGMRFLSEEKADSVFKFLDNLLSNRAQNPFHYESPHYSRILSGEEEGVFAWIAVNYLTGALQNSSKHGKTNGILELGGASTQIAFQPKANILADKFPVNIGLRKFPLYAHSYLYFGQDYVDLWVKEYLLNNTDQSHIENPCLLPGDNQSMNHTKSETSTTMVEFIGTGDANKCVHILGHLVKKVNPRFCHPKPCSIGSVYQPSIHRDQIFYAVSVFPMIFKDLGVLDKNNTFTPASVFEKSYEYCKKNYTALAQGAPAKRLKHISKPCIIGIYSALLFTKGYGFHNDSRQIIGSDVINNVTADWTLGALIYERASGFCPPITSTGSSLRPTAIFIPVPPLPFHSFLPLFQMTFFPTGSQAAVSILIYLVLGAIFKRSSLL